MSHIMVMTSALLKRIYHVEAQILKACMEQIYRSTHKPELPKTILCICVSFWLNMQTHVTFC